MQFKIDFCSMLPKMAMCTQNERMRKRKTSELNYKINLIVYSIHHQVQQKRIVLCGRCKLFIIIFDDATLAERVYNFFSSC